MSDDTIVKKIGHGGTLPSHAVTDGGTVTTDADIQSLIEALLAQEMEESPTRASALGVQGHDEELGESGDDAFSRRAASARRWAERLRAVGARGLSPERAVDRDLVLSALVGRTVMEDGEAWRRDPGVYLDPCPGGVHVLFVHQLRPVAELAAAAARYVRELLPGEVPPGPDREAVAEAGSPTARRGCAIGARRRGRRWTRA